MLSSEQVLKDAQSLVEDLVKNLPKGIDRDAEKELILDAQKVFRMAANIIDLMVLEEPSKSGGLH